MKRLKTPLSVILILIHLSIYSQVAEYNFDTDLTDQINGHNGTSTGTIDFLTENGKSYIKRNSSSLVHFPIAINSTITNRNFQFSFDHRTTSTTSTAIIFSSGSSANPFWEQAGFSVLQWADKILLTFDDGTSSGGYYWGAIGDITANQWKNYKITFDFVSKHFKVEIDGQEVKNEAINAGFDANSFRLGIQSNLFTIGGHNNTVNTTNNGVFDLDNLKIYDQVPNMTTQINTAFTQLANDISGSITLSDNDKLTHLTTIKSNLYFADYSSISTNLFAFTSAYEANNPPLYQDGITYNEDELPTHSRALLFSQSYVFATQFVDGNAQNMGGVVFEHHEVIPGSVDPSAVNIASATVSINGTYNKDIAAELNDQSRVVRPTGYYVRPGDVVTITVPNNVLNSGVTVIVGSHFRNMVPSYIGKINRFEDISAEYSLTSNATISVASPFGGGIYIKVPEGTNLGNFDVTIGNGIKMPFFSYKSGNQTSVSDWLNQVANSKAPWADFESDKFMFTIPVAEIAGVNNPDAIMQRWDAIMDAISIAGGRPLTRPRAEYYSFDTRLVTPAYGAGYPIIIPISEMRNDPNQLWNPMKVLEHPMHFTLLHEMGHNELYPTPNYGATGSTTEACHQIEAETNVHILAMAANSQVYNMSIEDAFGFSRANLGGDPFTFNEAVFDWIITTNFRQDLPMTFDLSVPMSDKDMLKYQSRGHAKYGDIVKLFGWDGLKNTQAAFYQAGVQQSSTVCNDRPFVVGRDEYTVAASNAVGKNMAPFMHFWGLKPSTSLQTQLASMPKSQEVKALIEGYQCNVAPITMDDYLAYHNTIMPTSDYQWPRYQQYINEFDATFAQQIQDQFNLILQTYGLIGSAAPTNVQGSNNNGTITLNWTDNSTDETGFVIKMKGPSDQNFAIIHTTAADVITYDVITSESGQYQFKVTAINADNLESNVCQVQTITVDTTLSVDEEELNSLFTLYPNPANDIIEIKGDLINLKEVKIYNLNGQQVKHFTDSFKELNISDLVPGIYITKLLLKDSSRAVKFIKQ
ncbi:M60 family metallopeptidase [Pseudotenacibaculum sp. MALMAid0570]|uniref:M60 family metallopeptidase n=1 Tax=Pseudotenacibaculum sp. MALMAid0570 TaxID=3143938 RepID=UPI0032DF8D64